ncbi:hypothetical protein CF319_g6963 [Tilletia indica]|nr:hypothetical protein CF319_g6963 [Tilletia indica]
MMRKEIAEQRRRRAEGAVANLWTGNDFLACLRRGGDAYPTHPGSEFAVMSQMSGDDVLYLCGAAWHLHTHLVGEVTKVMDAARTATFEGQLLAQVGHIFPDRPGLTLRKHASLEITNDSDFERAVAHCVNHVETPVVSHRRPSSKAEGAKAAVISAKELFNAL